MQLALAQSRAKTKTQGPLVEKLPDLANLAFAPMLDIAPMLACFSFPAQISSITGRPIWPQKASARRPTCSQLCMASMYLGLTHDVAHILH